MASVTLREVAQRAGVAAGTASRALSEDPAVQRLVSSQTARRVREAARSLGYQPNPVARSLKTRRSHTIGVVIPDLLNPLFPPIVRGIEDRLMRSGYVALLGNTDNDADREVRLIERMQSRQVDGLILATTRRDHRVVSEVGQHGVPVVMVNRVADDHSFPSVATDDVRGIGLVMAHLTSLGHCRLGHVAGPQEFSTGAGRYRGFLLGMHAVGLDPNTASVAFAQAFSVEEGFRCCRELLRQQPAVTAVVAANDMLALGCYQAIAEAGMRCPDDVSVVGFNDMPFIDRLSPPLTSVRFPHRQVGVEAAELMLEQIADRSRAAKALLVAPELVVRGSSARPPSRARRSAGTTVRRLAHVGEGGEAAS